MMLRRGCTFETLAGLDSSLGDSSQRASSALSRRLRRDNRQESPESCRRGARPAQLCLGVVAGDPWVNPRWESVRKVTRWQAATSMPVPMFPTAVGGSSGHLG